MPEGFAFPLAQEVWIPLVIDLSRVERGEGMTVEVFGRELMIRSVINLNAKPLVIEHTDLLTGRVGLPEAQYPDAASQYRFFEQLTELGIGLGAGLISAVIFAPFLSAILRGVSPFDPATLLGVALIVCVVALLASLIPALRVTPMEALRYE